VLQQQAARAVQVTTSARLLAAAHCLNLVVVVAVEQQAALAVRPLAVPVVLTALDHQHQQTQVVVVVVVLPTR
jgi:hypothetical protein